MLNMQSIFVINNPAGTWSFVGRVPASLSIERRDGEPLDPETAQKVAKFGQGLFKSVVKTRTWATEEAARIEADRLGFEVAS